jgi:hypothetical protein
LKTGIVETEDMVVARRRFYKLFLSATNTHAKTEELLDAVFSVQSVSDKISGREVIDYLLSWMRVRIPPP